MNFYLRMAKARSMVEAVEDVLVPVCKILVMMGAVIAVGWLVWYGLRWG